MTSGLKILILSALFLTLGSTGIHSAAQDRQILTLKTVVIDAGHGGNDPGTIWGNTREKDINLDVAVRFGALIEDAYPEVKVIYTRKRDVFIPLTERSAIANRANADLFISIHVNSVKGASKACGTETFLMGADKQGKNLEVCKRENSVITLEDDYSTKYAGYDPNDTDSYIFFNLMQNSHIEQSITMASLVEEEFGKGPIKHSRGIKQAPLLVLWQTTMPAVLVELGFLSNHTDREILCSRTNRGKIAQCLFNAFAKFKKQYEIDSAAKPAAEAAEPNPAEPAEPAIAETVAKPAVAAAQVKPESGKVWKIQIFAISKKLGEGDPKLKGLKCDVRKVGALYKYYFGSYESRQDAEKALPQIRKKFPDAFPAEVGL